MKKLLVEALQNRFQCYNDILDGVTEPDLGKNLEVPKHKNLAEHFWCLIGARESYAKAIQVGSWDGFSCSLTAYSKADFAEKLASSAAALLSAIDAVEEWTDERERLLLALAEHEVMHEGQIIRHLYGLQIDIPETVKWA